MSSCGAVMRYCSTLTFPNSLLPYITDRSKNVNGAASCDRHREACNVTALGDTLADIALEKEEAPTFGPGGTRSARIGDLELKSKLRPLIRTTTEEDPTRK